MRDVYAGRGAAVLLLACAADIALVDRYFLLATETIRVLILTAGALFVFALLGVSAYKSWSELARGRLRCLSLLSAVSLWTQLVLLPRVRSESWPNVTVLASALAVATFVLAIAYWRAVFSAWQRIGMMVCFAGATFVLSQPLLADILAPQVSWPMTNSASTRPGASSMLVARSAQRSATLFLLLDELNVEAAEGFVTDMQTLGLTAQQHQLSTEFDATARAIPAMWIGIDFSNARPCSFTAICSDGHALDFAKVAASRPDVDLVGFYHPYCAMTGLRYCVRANGSINFFAIGRWVCAVQRRWTSTVPAECEGRNYEHWRRLRNEVEDGMWRAPFWQEGGFMFAHVPLPHPPADHSTGSLRDDYSKNVDRARGLLLEAASRLLKNRHRNITIVVFSDHPLRIGLWCATDAYRASSCSDSDGLRSAKVPLMVFTLGSAMPALERLRSNREIFLLAIPENKGTIR